MEQIEKNTDTVEKTFTQEQVNAIIGERLAKEKAKGEAALAEREKQLVRRELTLTAKEKLNEMGLPLELMDALDVSSADALEKALKAVKTAFDKTKDNGKSNRQYEEYKLPEGKTEDEDPLKQLRKAMRLPD